MPMGKFRYWIVQVGRQRADSGNSVPRYIKDNEGNWTGAKTKAARLRDKDKPRFLEILESQGMPTDIAFLPTTYKPADAEFLAPWRWSWLNRQQDEGWD